MESNTDNTTLLAMLESMLRIRAYEEKAAALQAQGQAPGTCTAVGQEAVAVGVVQALAADDLILTNHRSAGHLLARGADTGRMLAEVMGKSTGYCKGKSGSLHISAKELGVVLTSTIVGAELSLATGVGLALAMERSAAIAVCFFGDGAACEGAFHESLNLAALWRLPILYVCENNQWQAFVHRREAMAAESVGDWAAAHPMPCASVDGNDAEAVYAAAAAAAAQVRSSRQPYFLEARTYRLRGHYEPDDQHYVDAKELAGWRGRDPIAALQARLLAQGVLSAESLERLHQRVAADIDNGLAFALASPYPAAEELATDVYA
ncbi:pyruvate dehydrogenase E1 component subunit alpha [Methylogaea oryzae]|uniref:Pyruvate dehydrogenase E1 component subunit alpha n=3 Tax=Methylogaea oryzae TaxID=1295382 RepID=A0A8D4VQ54_9GAMM|nr:pyruvate dehydrogenase E1 component subunit alpha [Methylogaea oryzae]